VTPELFAAGGVLRDCIVEADGTLHLDQPGGNAVFAAAAARLFADAVGVVGRVPADYPPAILAALREDGLDLAGVTAVPDETAAPEWFFHNADGSRTDGLHGHASELALPCPFGRRLEADTAQRWQRMLAEMPAAHGFAAFRARHPVRREHVPQDWWAARGVHLGANVVPHMLELARAARARTMLVTLDPGPRAIDLAPDELAELLGLVDAFMPSVKELAVLRPGLSPEAAACDLAQGARGLVMAKLGADGALLVSAEAAPVRVPAMPAAARDPTGAGDAFCGGFLAGLVQGASPIEAAHRATVAAAFAVETTGALALLRTPRAALAARLAAAM
jgi:sugar/nucleoside kinase (ribokinase family)